ncbi:MAG: TIGR04211 family SH3 domain-containing protein [Chromatiaceae bacterium]
MRSFVALSVVPLMLWLGAILALPVAAQAETRYVTDQLDITLRAGESIRYKILRMLRSGTPLEVLAVNKSTKYARVRTEDGTVGFVLEEQLQDEPAARAQLAEMETRLAELQQEPEALTAQLAKLQASYAELKERFATVERDKQRREQELATIRHASANVLDITNDRERLRIQVAELTRTRADLEQENRDLKNETNRRWFMIGAGVLGGGVLMGLILPHLRFGRRKSSWGSL